MWSNFLYNKRRNRTRRFYTEGFVPVDSLCGVVGSPCWFIKFLIGKTINRLWFMYINAKCMYYPKTCVYTIIECEIFYNLRHVNSTWTLFYWLSSDTNVSLITNIEIPSWKYLEVKFGPAAVCILSKSHQKNYLLLQICINTYLSYPWLPQ